MNIASALTSHSAKDILNLLSRYYPDLGPKIKQAAAAGYTAEQIAEVLSRNQQGLRRSKDSKYKDIQQPYGDYAQETNQFSGASTDRGSPTQRFMDQAGNFLGEAAIGIPAGIAGAAIGFARGGVPGAIAGGVGSITGINDAVKRYQQYTQEGGQGSFGEFLAGLAKSVGKGVGAGASAAGLYSLIKQLPNLLQDSKFAEFFNKKPQSSQTEQNQTAESQIQPIQEKISPEIAENVQKTEEKSQLDQEDSTGLKAMGGGMADAMSHNLYKGLFEALKQGKTKFAGIEDPLLAKAKPLFEKGLIKNQQDLQAFANGKLQTENKNLTRPSTPGPQEEKELKKDAASAVVRRMVYNPDDETLKVIFNNNAAYNYYDVPQDSWKKLSEGQATAKTDGQNEFGVWYSGKNPSVGAALNQYIKKPEYIYEKVEDDFVSQDDLDNVIQEIKAKVKEYKAAPKDGRKELFDEINRLRQVEANLRKALKKKPSQ